MNNQKASSSEMIRVPTALIPAVRELSRLHRQGHTIALLQALEDVIIEFDSTDDIKLAPSNKSLEKLEKHLDKIESQFTNKLDAISKSIEQLARYGAANNKGNSNQRSSRSYNPYHQPTLELEPFTHENLAKRLGLNAKTLLKEVLKICIISSKNY
jgi:DNA anti-recombination protein RmuC